MYFAYAIRQPDGQKFVEAIVKEVNGHMDNQICRLINRCEVPYGKPSNSQSGPWEKNATWQQGR